MQILVTPIFTNNTYHHLTRAVIIQRYCRVFYIQCKKQLKKDKNKKRQLLKLENEVFTINLVATVNMCHYLNLQKVLVKQLAGSAFVHIRNCSVSKRCLHKSTLNGKGKDIRYQLRSHLLPPTPNTHTSSSSEAQEAIGSYNDKVDCFIAPFLFTISSSDLLFPPKGISLSLFSCGF